MFSRTTSITLGIAALLGASIGISAVSATAAPPTTFSVNPAGKSYGSAANTPIKDAPDLIEAVGDDGTSGFVLKKDLVSPALTPAQAVDHEKRVRAGADDSKVIPLVDVNGKKIGTFTVEQGVVVEK